MDRRDFLKKAGVTTVAGSLGAKFAHATDRSFPYRVLGHTGEKVSLIGIGGHHVGRGSDEAQSIRIVRTALDNGVNFLDNCWDYNNGVSEERMGKALRDGYRAKAFLMTKIDGQTKKAALQQLEESLRRLQTDHIDLLQFHEVIRETDPARIFADGGSFDAAQEAKKQGKIRYIGFTGHKSPDIHLKMLETAFAHNFTFDSVQMPLNVMDAHFRSFTHMVLPELVKQEIGVLGMKSMGDGVILKSKAVTAIECLHYALSLPTSVVITGIEKPEILDQAFEAAKTFEPMDRERVALLLARTKEIAMAGKYELFKTSSHFDSTAKHPDWLGGDVPGVQQLAPSA
jgi:aryl-alcohol dehydrogenase-like predicted oxidoreductase